MQSSSSFPVLPPELVKAYLEQLGFFNKTKFGNRKLQKTWLVILFGPLAAILNFTQKCKQTAVSQKLSKIKNFFKIFFSSHEVPKLLGQ